MPNSQVPLPPFAQERWFAEFEFQPGVRQVCASGAYGMTNAELLALEPGADEAFGAIYQEYSENRGAPALRAQVAERYPGLGADDVVVTHGASEAILLFALAAFRPGETVVLEEPLYGSYRALAQWLGAQVRELRLDPGRGWALDLEALERLLSDGRVAWVVLNPFHNPTGAPRGPEVLGDAGAMAERHGARLVTDDVFLPVSLDGPAPAPSASIFPSAVSIGDVSKPWGLGGLRIGWLALRDAGLRETLVALRHYSTISSARNSEWLATLALRHAERILAPRLERARANRAVLEATVEENGDLFESTRVAGGYSAFVRLKGSHAGASTEPLCRELVARERILLLPGSVMGARWQEYVRVGLDSDPDDFRSALGLLRARLGGPAAPRRAGA